MAEEKRFQMERGSIGGSYFMVQLPDGSMEKRMKMPLNIDPGVHSSFHLDELVGMPGTPMNNQLHTVATLPTISEAKVQEQSGSSGNSSNGSGDGQVSNDVKTSARPVRSSESKVGFPFYGGMFLLLLILYCVAACLPLRTSLLYKKYTCNIK